MKTIYNNVLRLLVVALMAMPLLATAQEKLSGTGTAADPYLIGTAENLEEFASIVNANTAGTKKCARLTADIDYTGKTARIGTNSSYPYQGTFDGDNHTITVALGSNTTTTSCLALFTNISGNVEIKNLKVDGSVQSANVNAGGVVGKILSGATAKLTNVSSSVTITLYYKSSSYYGYQAGGVVGLVSGGATFNNVTSNAVISYSGTNTNLGKQSGGVVGYISSGTVTFTDVTSNAEITIKGQHAGGIVGYVYNGNITINKAASYVNIKYEGSLTSSFNGGVIGRIGESSFSGNVSITNCAFYGSFTGGGENGGLIGQSFSKMSIFSYVRVEMKNSYVYFTPQDNDNFVIGKFVAPKEKWDAYNKINNCCYLITEGSNSGDNAGIGFTADKFKDGTVCRLLNELKDSEDRDEEIVWRQNLSGNVDTYPVTDNAHDCVHNVSTEGYDQEKLFKKIDISGFLNQNAVRGINDPITGSDKTNFDGSNYFLSKDYSNQNTYLPTSFDNTHTIKGYYGFNVPFNMSWDGDHSRPFEGKDCIRINNTDAKDNVKQVTVSLSGTDNKFNELYLCASCGGTNINSPAKIDVIITYDDEDHQNTSFFIPDWAQELPNGYHTKRSDNMDGSVFCFPLNDALDATKNIKSITFVNNTSRSDIYVGIFGITGLALLKPQAPTFVVEKCLENSVELKWTEVTTLEDGNAADDGTITYVYDVANDSDFNDIVEGYENKPLTGTSFANGVYTANLSGEFCEKYIRVRAVNIVGQSLSTEAIVMPLAILDNDTEMQAKIQKWIDYCAPESESPNPLDVQVMRTFSNEDEYYTICLPFDVSATQIESELQGCSVYKYKQARINNGVLDIVFESATEIEAGVPYFVRWSDFGENESVENPVFENVIVKTTVTSNIPSEYATCHGTLVSVQLTPGDKNKLFLIGNNTFQWPSDSDETTFKGLRAYLEVNSTKVRYGMPTSIVDNPDADIEIEEPEVQKLYQNGRIVIIKDGVKYDLFGRLIE